MLELSMCNELLAGDGLSLDEQCARIAALGYIGVELSPGTLAATPHEMSADDWAATRATVERHGLHVTGLHWLLAPYPDLSIFDPNDTTRVREVLISLVGGCAALGGDVLVHGSPSSRERPEGMGEDTALDIAAEVLAPVAGAAEAAGVTYCIEPLSPAETNFVNTVAQGVRLVERVASPTFRTMIDTSAAGLAEAEPVADLIRRWGPTGHVAHIQLNDTNRGAPGMGADPFGDILAAMIDVGWDRPAAVEPFRIIIDGTVTAAIGIATLRALEAMS